MPESSQNVDQLPPENQHLSPSPPSAIPVRMPLHGIIIQQPGNEVYDRPQQMFGIGPPPTADCPPGLEYLAAIDQLLVKQKIELFEVFTGWEGNNQYTVKNSLGQDIYHASEENDCCTRQCCGTNRSFNMKIADNRNQEILRLNRPFRCTSCCCPCCLQELEVSSPPETPIGYVIQKWSLCAPRFEIQDAQKNPVLLVEGPICLCRCWSDIEFKVLSLDGVTQIGCIAKQWSGFVQEAFTDADNFGVTFPMDLDVKVKAIVLGATFLIDFMYFESTGNRNRMKAD